MLQSYRQTICDSGTPSDIRMPATICRLMLHVAAALLCVAVALAATNPARSYECARPLGQDTGQVGFVDLDPGSGSGWIVPAAVLTTYRYALVFGQEAPSLDVITPRMARWRRRSLAPSRPPFLTSSMRVPKATLLSRRL